MSSRTVGCVTFHCAVCFSQLNARSPLTLHPMKLAVLITLMTAPHPSLLIVLVNHYLRTMHAPVTFLIHLCISYTLTFLSFSSLIVCVARDPGPVSIDKPTSVEDSARGHGRADLGLREALMEPLDVDDDDGIFSPVKWCRKCWAPKPERTHHCSLCGRCVLKMDHHCPWLGSRCVGHRTYPAFFHFIASITLLSTHVAIFASSAFWWSFNNPGLTLDETTPLHELFLLAVGTVFGIVMGSFTIYHMYLISTNQTTLESLSPFSLLRHIPPLPVSLRLSDPPLEHELSYNQRRLVRDAHSAVKLYDLGWRRNWGQVFGWSRPRGWIPRILYGGSSQGSGRRFPRNPRAEDMLSRLAAALVTADKDA
ncbi:DHHC palmitoyltransferase-domain-containing protein [Scleroderma citrinum]